MKVIPKDSFGNKADIDEESVQIEIRKVNEDSHQLYGLAVIHSWE